MIQRTVALTTAGKARTNARRNTTAGGLLLRLRPQNLRLKSWKWISNPFQKVKTAPKPHIWPRGPMDKASACGAGDCRSSPTGVIVSQHFSLHVPPLLHRPGAAHTTGPDTSSACNFLSGTSHHTHRRFRIAMNLFKQQLWDLRSGT